MSIALFEAALTIGRTDAEFDILAHFTDGPYGVTLDSVLIGDVDIITVLDQSVKNSLVEEIQDYKRFDIIDPPCDSNNLRGLA